MIESHPMKLQPDRTSVQTITGYGPGWVGINGVRHAGSQIVGSAGQLRAWAPARFEDLGPEHFAELVELGCELIVFGSGPANRFPNPAWLAPLYARRIGVETMDTGAACRTYNILAGEGRSVVAALLVAPEPSAA
jgi:uncharacterized protein